MENLLCFDKPEKVSNGKGTYVPNMSEEDKNKWKAVHVKGDDERIEIRKTIGGAQLLVIVYKKELQVPKPEFPEYDGGGRDSYWEQANIIYTADCNRYKKRHQNIRLSANGKLDMTWDDWWDLSEVVKEALEILI